jgi:hypothetical protein
MMVAVDAYEVALVPPILPLYCHENLLLVAVTDVYDVVAVVVPREAILQSSDKPFIHGLEPCSVLRGMEVRYKDVVVASRHGHRTPTARSSACEETQDVVVRVYEAKC